jgi:hypothetical protein
MSSSAEIRAVYQEEKRRPYYSLSDVARRKPCNVKPLPVKEARVFQSATRWIWGHFSTALREALAHPILI